MIDSVAEELVPLYLEGDTEEQILNVEALRNEIDQIFGLDLKEDLKENKADYQKVIEILKEKAHKQYEEKENEIANPDEFICPTEVFEELTKTSHRQYSTGFYFGRDNATQTTDSSTYIREWDLLAVAESWENGTLYCSQRGKFVVGDEIEVLQPDGSVFKFTPEKIYDEEGNEIENTAHSMMKFSVPCETEVKPLSILRKIAK